jgi:hypothetical protein
MHLHYFFYFNLFFWKTQFLSFSMIYSYNIYRGLSFLVLW